MAYRYSLLLAATTMLILPNASRADVLPFFPRDTTVVRLQFKNLDQYPDFDFYVKYGAGPDHQRFNVAKVSPNSSAQLFSWGRTTLGTASLVAVPRGEAIEWKLKE